MENCRTLEKPDFRVRTPSGAKFWTVILLNLVTKKLPEATPDCLSAMSRVVCS